MTTTAELFYDARDLYRCPTVHSEERSTIRWNCLYRYYDEAGVLLYVGIAECPERRMDQHERTSAWFDLAYSRADEWFTSRKRVADAERAAIKTEDPVFNRSGVSREDRRLRPCRYLQTAA